LPRSKTGHLSQIRSWPLQGRQHGHRDPRSSIPGREVACRAGRHLRAETSRRRVGVTGSLRICSIANNATDRKTLSIELLRRDFEGDSYTETEIMPWTKAAVRPLTSGTELSVERIGDQISIFVDGQESNSVRDDKFDQGLVGFVISGPGAPRSEI
jgi:hypothetical protein